MVAHGISKSELVSRAREFLRGLSREEIKQLSREEFARVVGVDPLNTPSEYKRELARMMYHEFGLPYRKICELLAMSARDVAKAVKSGVKAKRAVEEAKAPMVDVEVQAKAIELVRSGEARNPNDLVLKLKIPLDIAEQLFNRIVENEKITVESTINAVVRIERSVKSIKQYAEKFEELEEKTRENIRECEEKVKECEERARKIVKDLDEALNDMMKMVQDLEKHVKELRNEVFGLGIMLTAGGVEIRTLKDLLGRVKQLEDKVSKLEEKHENSKRKKANREEAEFGRKIENSLKLGRNRGLKSCTKSLL